LNTDYKPVVSTGTLPKDFVTLSSKKYSEAKKSLTGKEKRSTRKTKEKFLLQSNFSLDDILLSGKVLFNDPMASYVNKVADKLLAGNPKLRSELRFYVLKSTAVNAFATNQGVIFVTVGMLAQIEDEAQLAFVLSHEIVHYQEKHSIEKYLEADKLIKGKETYKRMSLDEKLIAKCSFSKEQEKEADEKGLQMFLKSGYSTETILGLYDVLKYSYLPFDDVAFDIGFLENSTYKFPKGYLVEETKPITTAEIEEEDERSTHPNLKSRRESTTATVKGLSNEGKSVYLVGQTDFENAREIARFEVCRTYTMRHQYEDGLYTAYLLLKKYPDNLYLKKLAAQCLSGLSQYAKINEFEKVHKDAEDVEGKSQAVTILMDKLDSVRGDITVASVAYLAKLKKDYPNDNDINTLFKTQMRLLTKSGHYSLSDFSKVAPTPPAIIDSLKAVAAANTTDTKEEKEETETSKSKYDKLREQSGGTVVADKKTGAVIENGRYTRYAFVEFMNETWFTTAFETAAKSDHNKEEESISIEEEMSSKKRYYDKRTYALGVDKVVVVDPYYARINARKKDKYKFLQSEAGQVDFAERLKYNAKAAKLGVEVLNTKDLKEGDIEKANEIALLEEYIGDRMNHEKDINMPCLDRDRILSIAKKYNTNHFMWTGTISLTDKNRFNPLVIMYSILLPPSLMLTMPSLINGGQYTLYFAIIYDVSTDKVRFATFREINNRTRGFILDSHLYDVMTQIKSKKAK
jgi:predicted Zn-dependent protease